MDPELLKIERAREKAKIREEVLAELKEEYYLKPKNEKLEVNDILEKYMDQLLSRSKEHFKHNGYSQSEAIKQAIRKVLCLHYDVYAIKEIPKEEHKQFREDMEEFMISYLHCIRR